MKYSALMQDERREAYQEGCETGRVEERKDVLHCHIVQVLASKGSVTEVLKEKIEKETDVDILEQWFDYAVNCKNIEEFAKESEQSSI